MVIWKTWDIVKIYESTLWESDFEFDNKENGPLNPLGQFDCNTLRPGKVYELSIVESHDFISSLHAIDGKSFNFRLDIFYGEANVVVP